MKRERRLRNPRDGDEQLFEYDLDAPGADTKLNFVFAANYCLPDKTELKNPQSRPENGKKECRDNLTDSIESNNVDGKSVMAKQAEKGSSVDPLAIDIFIGHHRRMEREERRMQQLERQQLLVDFGRVTTQRAQLLESNWKQNISRIVRIEDPDDTRELTVKRDLAVAEIDMFLNKYREYKRRKLDTDTPDKTPHKEPERARDRRERKKKPSKPPKPVPVAHGPVNFSLRPTAFGFMVPDKVFPPREFSIPKSWQK